MRILFYTILILLTGLFLQTTASPANAQGWTDGQKIVSGGNTGLPESTIKDVIFNILMWLLGLIFLLTVLAFVGSGIMFIMSFSNSGIISMAKDWLTYAIIGLIVSVLGFAIVVTISKILTK